MKYLLAMAIAVGLAGPGHAATLNFLGSVENAARGAKTYVTTTIRGSLTCATCLGLDSTQVGNTASPKPVTPDAGDANGFIGAIYADLFDLGNASQAGEAAFVSAVTGISFGESAQLPGGGGAKSFFSSALYILFKIGSDPNYALVKNTGTIGQQYSYANLDGQGAGLSHYVEYGKLPDPPPPPPPSPVPLPASALLMFLGIGSLSALRRRRSA